MKLLFIFDTILIKKEKNDYFGMTLNNDFFNERYIPMFEDLEELIITTRVKDAMNEKGNISGYKIVNGNKISVKPIKSYKEIPDAIKKRKAIKKELTEIISTVDELIIRMPSVLGMFACTICEKLNKKYMIELVACPLDGYMNHTNSLGKLIAPIMYFETRKKVKKAPKVLYVTNEFLQKRYPTNGESCACSDVVIREENQSLLDERTSKIKNTDINNLKFCTVANVGMKYKGHEYVFKSLAKFKDKNYKYYLIGNGDSTRLKELAKKLEIEEKIVFVGSLSHDKVFEKLKEMDIYIQPSLQEGLPRALIEAMSLGLPCIGSYVGGIPELLESKMTFKKRNVKELNNIIESITKDVLLEESINNYNKSLEYCKRKLDKKRTEFYKNI